MPALTNKYATPTATKGYSSSCADGYVTADIQALVQNWANATPTSRGMAVKASSETDNFFWKRFYSGNNSTNKPKLSVTYNNYPNTPSSVKVNGVAPAAGAVYYTNDITPTFSAVVSDPDGGQAKGRFTITSGSTTYSTRASGSMVASGSTSSFTPTNLTQGKAYTVEAWANDGTVDSKASIKPTWTVYVDTVAPGATNITTSQFGNGQWLDDPPPSLSTTFTSTDAVKFEYRFDGSPVKTVAASGSGSATVSAGLSLATGYHTISARSLDRAGNTSAWKYFNYGIGSLGISAPKPGYKTIDKVAVKSSARPGTQHAVERSIMWRPSGSNVAWQVAETLDDVDTLEDPSVDVEISAKAIAETAGKERVPFAIDLQVCYLYTQNLEEQCTWDDQDPHTHTSIVRVPSAFGDNFPVASAGPGQVALWTGEFNTSISDLEVPGYTGTLSLSRNYSTFLGGTEDSVFGPGWKPSFDGADVGAAGLEVYDSTDDDGMIALEDEEGSYLLYAQANNGAVAQGPGVYEPIDEDTAALGYTLTLTGSGTAARLSLLDDEGVTTTWAHLGGGDWVQESVTEPGNAGTTTFAHDQDGRVTRILAPVPHGLAPSVCAGSNFAAGCRALYIEYYTATGSGGAFKDRVSKVKYRAWDPAAASGAGAIGYQDVATYRYTSTGLLESVTDERSGIAVTYTYTTSSAAPVPLLTSVKPGGLAKWNMEYNSAAELVRVTRDAPTGSGPVVPMSRYVYRFDTATPPSGTPNVRSLVNAWGQTRVPSVGFAVFGPDEDPGTTIDANEWKNAQLSYTDDLGYTLNSAEFGAGRWLLTADEFDEHGNIVRSLDAAAADYLSELSANNGNQPVTEAEVNAVASITRYNAPIVASAAIEYFSAGATEPTTIPAGTELVPAGTFITDSWSPAAADGANGRARVHTQFTYDGGAPNAGINPLTGKPFSLVTTTVEFRAAATTGTWDLEVPVATGEPVLSESRSGYDPIDAADVLGPTSGWILGAETVSTLDMGTDPDIVSKTRYDSLGRAVETRGPGSNGADAGTQLSYFYTVDANPDAPTCGGTTYAKWAGLPCLTRTGETTATVPTVHSSGYSMLLAPATIVEQLGSVTRTTTTEFLSDGRTHATELTVTGLSSSVPVARTEIAYDPATALPVATIAKVGGVETGRVSTTSDLWGRNLTYTDADSQTTTNTYDTKGRLATVVDPERAVTYGYDGADAAGNAERRSLGTSMTIVGVGTFTAAYDASGNMTVQHMPGGITQEASYTLTGEPVALSYSTLDEDDERVPLLGWEQQSDLYGRVVAESTPSAGQAPGTISEFNRAYLYDRADRLVKVEDRTAALGESVELPGSENDITPCVTRTYAFDLRGNRESRSTAISGPSGVCTTTGGFTEAWTYDGADRVETGANDTGAYQYDALGRQTVLPAIDSPMGSSAGNLQIGYYHDDLVASLTQDGTTTTFELDPLSRRTTSTTVTGTDTTTVVRHYADASDNPAFVVATDANSVVSTTWYGSSLGGDLGVTVTDDVTTVQLADIHGDIAIPVILDDGEIAAIGGYSDYDEYGRPLAGTASPDTGGVSYGWLGGKERATDEATGLMLMGVRLYNPNTGLFTSVDPVPGGNTTAYTYPQDPINKFDLDGKAWGWVKKLKKAAKAVAKVADVVAFIPGPIGMIAAGVGAAALLATGDFKGAAMASAGLVPGGKLIATAAKVAGKVAKVGKAAKDVRRITKAAKATRGNGPGFGKEIVVSKRVANIAGRVWVGPGARKSSNGTAIVSKNKLRQYRPPAHKKGRGYSQANFESRAVPKGRWVNNFHVRTR